jgi:hypothetical protein
VLYLVSAGQDRAQYLVVDLRRWGFEKYNSLVLPLILESRMKGESAEMKASIVASANVAGA